VLIPRRKICPGNSRWLWLTYASTVFHPIPSAMPLFSGIVWEARTRHRASGLKESFTSNGWPAAASPGPCAATVWRRMGSPGSGGNRSRVQSSMGQSLSFLQGQPSTRAREPDREEIKCNAPRFLPRKKAELVMIISLAANVRNRAGRADFRERGRA